MPTLPTSDPTQLSLQKQIADLQREVRLLKEKPRSEDIPANIRTEVCFAAHGEVLVDDQSGSYLIKDFDATIHRLDWTARIGGASTSTGQVILNGIVLYEFDLAAGETSGVFSDLALDVEEYDRLSVQFSVVGDGLDTVVLTFQIIAVEGEEYT